MAGIFSQEIIERIRAASDIVDVIGSYLPLKRAGANFVGLSSWALCGLLFAPDACIGVEALESNGQPATNRTSIEITRDALSGHADELIARLKAEPSFISEIRPYLGPIFNDAAKQANLDLIKVLLESGVPANGPMDTNSNRGETALGVCLGSLISSPRWGRWVPDAERTNRLASAQLLLQRGASIFSTNRNSDFGGPGDRLIDRAARGGDGGLVDFLILNQQPATGPAADEKSLVHLAAVLGRTNVILELVAGRGAKLQATNEFGFTPLQTVARLPSRGRHAVISNWDYSTVETDGAVNREETARFLVTMGATADIFSAAALGWTNEINTFVERLSGEEHALDPDGRTAMFWALEADETGIIPLLLPSGMSVETQDRNGTRPLDVAVAKNQTGTVRLLLNYGASVLRDAGATNPLHSATQNGNLTVAGWLCDLSADVNAENNQGESSLDIAARRNQTAIAGLLLGRGARLKTASTNMNTPFHWAVIHGNTNLINLLLAAGARIDSPNFEGKPPILLAHERNSFPTLAFLLRKGAKLTATDTNGNNALHLRAAAETDCATNSMMEFLMTNGLSPNSRNRFGETPLHRVAFKSFPGSNATENASSWIVPLLKHHADLDARDRNGRTPLHAATEQRNLPVMEALIRAGADLTAKDHKGDTPLHVAARTKSVFENCAPVMTLLLTNGARANVRNNNRETPLHVALLGATQNSEVKEAMGLVTLLLEAGAGVHDQDRGGKTPLHLACGQTSEPPCDDGLWSWTVLLPGDHSTFSMYSCAWTGDFEKEVPQMLIAAGANVNARDKNGNTPLIYAVEAAREHTVEMLLKSGATCFQKNEAGQIAWEVACGSSGGHKLIPLLQPPGTVGEVADAARRADIKSVRAFLRFNPRFANRRWLFGTTPLQWACNGGHLEIAKLLLDHGAIVDPPKPIRTDKNRMMEANQWLSGRHMEERQHPLNTNDPAIHIVPADELEAVNSTPIFETPLQLAIAGGHHDLARLLIEHGAEVDLVSAIMLGMTNEVKRVVRADSGCVSRLYRLVAWKFGWQKAPAFTNDKLSTGTPLHFAIESNNPVITKMVVEAGADLSAVDALGDTPCQLATRLGRTNLVHILCPPSSSP